MPSHTSRRTVAHSAAAMLALVAEVERYPEFVPLCERLIVRSRATDGAAEIVIAAMEVGYGPVEESFVSRVRIDRPGLRIDVSLIEGPFKRLENRWTFHPLGEGSEIEFAIDYEFDSMALQILMGAVFDRAFSKYVAAFEARADAIYGKQGGDPVAT